ncbi:MAG: alpha/beta hydrolase, partial [Actinomycetota bacterium]|nr:alpha/beta hydrolase [Actinomycetota bacterium]
MPVAEQVVLVDGPWTHRQVTAGGVRFHVAGCGPDDGPLVLLLHGFPEFWWAWRSQLVALGAAGFRAVAPDLRGHGASDKPPRGYDAYTLSADVAGLVRALGARDAVLVGSGWGGVLAWAAATLHPRLVRRLAVLAAPHPLRLGEAVLRDPAQARASSPLAFL